MTKKRNNRIAASGSTIQPVRMGGEDNGSDDGNNDGIPLPSTPPIKPEQYEAKIASLSGDKESLRNQLCGRDENIAAQKRLIDRYVQQANNSRKRVRYAAIFLMCAISINILLEGFGLYEPVRNSLMYSSLLLVGAMVYIINPKKHCKWLVMLYASFALPSVVTIIMLGFGVDHGILPCWLTIAMSVLMFFLFAKYCVKSLKESGERE